MVGGLGQLSCDSFDIGVLCSSVSVIVKLLVIVRAMVTIVKVKVHWFIGFCVLFVSGC